MRRAALVFVLASSAAAQTPEELFKQGKYEDAKRLFAERAAKNGKDANALFYMGRIAEETNHADEAVDWYEKALKLNDTSATYHFWLGSATGDLAQNASKFKQPFLARKVKAEFERASQLDPAMLEPRLGLVDFYVMAPGFMGGSTEKAHQQANEIKKLHPYRGYYAEARIASRQKNPAAEGKAYEEALAAAKVAAPDSTAPWFSLAAYHRRQSRWDDAFALYDSIARRWPNDIAVHLSYGYAASLSGKQMERGERELKLYLEHPPKDMTDATASFVRYHLGQIYEKSARKDAAKAEYIEAVRLNKDNGDAKKALVALK
jgi:tetratricopeptide (TPR) repeat protein